MPPAAVKPVAPRKRNRKRKRRAASESSSSSSSSDSDSDEEQTKPPVAKQIVQPEESSSESSDTSSESESEHEAPVTTVSSTTARKSIPSKKPQIVRRTPSPSPPPSKIPDFINSKVSENKDAQEQIMKDKFRRFWMTSVADGFKDDLEEIRKEQNLGTARLSLLIDSLASGADIFTSSSRSNQNNINEVGVILE